MLICIDFLICAPICALYIYIYMAFRIGLRRDLRRDFVSCIFYISCSCHAFCMQFMPLLMQANHFFHSTKCTRVTYGSLDWSAPVTPIVSWLVISCIFPYGPPLIFPIYFQTVTCARAAPVTFWKVLLAPYFPYIFLDFFILALMFPMSWT